MAEHGCQPLEFFLFNHFLVLTNTISLLQEALTCVLTSSVTGGQLNSPT